MVRNATNKPLQQAKKARKDEFYTVLSDVERELKHYKNHFAGKTVLANCDDPRVSNFFHYFSHNFAQLGLKKLVTTSYQNMDSERFSRHDVKRGLHLEYHGGTNSDRVPDADSIGIKELEGDGDFRSNECIDILQDADIIVTNPPFSLFRDYVAQLIEHDKKFLIIGTWNAITYKDIFRLIREDKAWIGVNSNRNFSGFIVPDHYPLHGTEARTDEKGNRIVSSNNTCWFTNLDNKKRHEKLILYEKFSPQLFPEYDNYNAIEVKQTNKIPVDYDGVMGVPITFLNKYNPEQFEIVGADFEVKDGLHPELIKPEWEGKLDRAYLAGKRKYARLFIRHRT